jgi:spoIIIJ-associated protein
MSEDLQALAKLRLEEMLSFFGVNAAVKITEEDNAIRLNVEADTTGRLIGHRGETLRALQHLLNVLVRARTTENVYISLDIAGYKQALADRLAAKAKQAAEEVIETGKEHYLRPMNAAERRIVHMALADISGVYTESTGEDPNRRVIIKKRD